MNYLTTSLKTMIWKKTDECSIFIHKRFRLKIEFIFQHYNFYIFFFFFKNYHMWHFCLKCLYTLDMHAVCTDTLYQLRQIK